MNAPLKKILIVEDSELLHRMYELVFRKERMQGCTLLHAFHGREGIEILSKNPDVDLVLLDINMPVMSGLEFLRTVKREGAFRDLKIVIVSTEGKEEDTLRGLESGARAYITKPFQPADLHKLIARILAEPAGELASAR